MIRTKKRKTFGIGVLGLILCGALIMGCGADKNDINMRVAALKGPTAMGLVKFMADADDMGEQSDYKFSILASVDEVIPKLIQGEFDLAAVPANLASVLYHKTNGEIRVLAVNTLGVLYLVETGDTVTSLEDLKGKTIYASGKGATPEYALTYILEKNGINIEKDVTIEWKAEHTECVAAVAAKEGAVAMLPQPFVTTAMKKNGEIKIAVDLNAEWDKLQEGSSEQSGMVTGVLVGRNEFLEENKKAVSDFMKSYKASAVFVNENMEEAAGLIEQYDIVPAAVAKEAIPYCNIVCIDGKEGKEKLAGYLQILMDENPEAVGGAVPQDDFYYEN